MRHHGQFGSEKSDSVLKTVFQGLWPKTVQVSDHRDFGLEVLADNVGGGLVGDRHISDVRSSVRVLSTAPSADLSCKFGTGEQSAIFTTQFWRRGQCLQVYWRENQ